MSKPNDFPSGAAAVAKIPAEDMPQFQTEFGGARASGGAVAIPVIPTDENVDEASR